MSHKTMRVFVSGIQPTGNLHIGNYLGFIKSFVRFQNDSTIGKRVLLIADLHSMSTGYQAPNQMRANIFRTLATLLACGIDPAKTMLVQQSRLAEHTEMMWILGSAATLPSLTSLGQFKDKSASYIEGFVPVGLVTYPLLQAADILTHKATHVPVGDDQTQHMYLVRHIAKKFNQWMGCDFFPIPEGVRGDCARLKSLRNPAKKMSKSDENEKSRIELTDTPEATLEKIKKAVTDFEPQITFDPTQRPGVSNLVSLYSLFSGLTVDQVVQESKGLITSEFKLKLASLVNEKLSSIRENFLHYIRNEEEMMDILRHGEREARPTAIETLQKIKQIIGLA